MVCLKTSRRARPWLRRFSTPLSITECCSSASRISPRTAVCLEPLHELIKGAIGSPSQGTETGGVINEAKPA